MELFVAITSSRPSCDADDVVFIIYICFLLSKYSLYILHTTHERKHIQWRDWKILVIWRRKIITTSANHAVKQYSITSQSQNTRNSVIADKPRDAFVQTNWRADLLNMPSVNAEPMPNLILLRTKDVDINTGEPQKLGSAATSLSWDGRRQRPKDAPPQTCVKLTRKIWQFCNKGCTQK